MYITEEQQKKLRELILKQGTIVADAYKNRFSLETHYKSDGCDFATETDEQVEKNLVEGILSIFPTAIIHGEEYGFTEKMTDDRLIFVIDPIDGTKYFRFGITLFTISIGIQFAGKNIYGLILNPMSGDIIFGGPDYGVYNQFGKIEPPEVKPLEKTQVYFDTVGIHDVSSEDQEQGLELIKNISLKSYRSRSAGASCMFAFGATSGLIGAIIDIFGGVKITDQVGFFAILEGLGWETREISYGEVKTSWIAPSKILDNLLTLILPSFIGIQKN